MTEMSTAVKLSLARAKRPIIQSQLDKARADGTQPRQVEQLEAALHSVEADIAELEADRPPTSPPPRRDTDG